jgi:hypothetical protein
MDEENNRARKRRLIAKTDGPFVSGDGCRLC